MAAFKCKYCGGDIYPEEGQSLVTCEYCQREQSLTKSKSDIVVNLFNRANSLRLRSDFDKSQEVYEKILVEEPGDAEAHWGIVLCKYGIEYVKEGDSSYSEIPTCHRAQFESIFSDVDYLAAVENADISQRSYYEAEGKKISELQKNILQVVKNEKPFDVFICYKEKDENGQRTVDSSIANDIYYQLTEEGFKVFYAAITLEDKLGTAYEPYIFAALNSAKVMLVLGTKPEYFNAVWVKNEWARYLKLMKTDRSRSLFPCFRDMDAYELPEEFAHLQAQDMSKVGFITDIIRGIKKLVRKESPKPAASTSGVSTAANAVPLLKRAFLCIEDKDYQKAESLLEQVLNMDPECAEAYIAKLLIEKKYTSREQLYSFPTDLENEPMYIRALRFADDKYKATLQEYRNESVYRRACACMPKNSIEKFNEAINLFDRVEDYKDSADKKNECFNGIADINYREALRLSMEAMNQKDTSMAENAAEKFAALGDYKDSARRVEECNELRNEITYTIASENKQRAAQYSDVASVRKYYDSAISGFTGLFDYKDSKAQIEECQNLKVEALYNIAMSTKANAEKRSNADQYIEAAEIFDQILDYKDSCELVAQCRNKARDIQTEAKYDTARVFVKRDDIKALNEAIAIYESIIDWKDSETCLANCRTRLAQLQEKGENDRRRQRLTSELQSINEKEAKNRDSLRGVGKLKVKKTYYRIMGIIALVVVVASVLASVSLDDTLGETSYYDGWFTFIMENYNGEDFSNYSDGKTVFDIADAESFDKVILLTHLVIIPTWIIFGVLLGLNLLVTMAIEGKLLLIFIPFVNIFVVLFYIIVSVKNMIVPLNSYERSKIRTGKRIHKESAPMMKRKKEIEAELRSISA